VLRDAKDYYERCSAAPLVPEIKLPCQVLFALDDPFIDGTILDGKPLSRHVTVWHTAKWGLWARQVNQEG
jgi:predicted alpha/beta-fold hydrolase